MSDKNKQELSKWIDVLYKRQNNTKLIEGNVVINDKREVRMAQSNC